MKTNVALKCSGLLLWLGCFNKGRKRMKKTKLHEVITIDTKHDIAKMHERVGYHLGTGKKIDVKIKNGSVHITEQEVKKHG